MADPTGATRREFLVAGGSAAVVAFLGALLKACEKPLHERWCAAGGQVPCREPSTVLDRTFVAIADTVVPGCASDPTGAPGAPEACVLNLAADPSLPVAGVVELLVAFADSYARSLFAAQFLELDLDQRTQALSRMEADFPEVAYAFRFFRAAYYGGLYNDVGPRALGYPGGNLGHVAAPDFSFRKPVCRERTPDGNLP